MVLQFLSSSPGFQRSVPSFRRIFLVGLLTGSILGMEPVSAVDLLHSTFESSVPMDNPWTGTATTGVIAVRPGTQPAVDNEGRVTRSQFGPSVAVGDLDGDGLPDLVIGDARGYFWFFRNSGTLAQPKFTQGEVMPIWIGPTPEDPDFGDVIGASENIVPRVQLISLAGTKLLDIVAGNYNGRLFYLRNVGSTTQPQFKISPSRLKDCLVRTRKDGLLWCNFLSPFLFDWFGTGNLDLIMGDGSYSANSVFLFKNLGNRDSPTFNQTAMTKIIPGMGREHLTPQVVDWNNDGKPDIICGDREGHVNLFLNTSTDPKQPIPTFDAGQLVKLGGKDTFGALTTATVCDLTGNKLPNLIITNNLGAVSYAQNTGKPGAPQFGDPVPIHAENPLPKIYSPNGWALISPHGVPYELLVCTNATVEPGFTPPPDTPWKSALRYYVDPVRLKNTFFTDFYYPLADQLFSDLHRIRNSSEFELKENTPYHVSFWVRSEGVTDLKYTFHGYRTESGENDFQFDTGKDIGSGSSWQFFQSTMSLTFGNKKNLDNEHEAGRAHFEIHFNGQGNVYLDDVKISTD